MYFNNIHYHKLNDFVFNYTDNHRDELKGWVLDDFIVNFDADNQIFNTYLKSIPTEFQNMDENETQNLKKYLKALFAQQIFDINAYFKIINKQDKMINKVIQLNKDGYPILQ